MPTPTKYKTKFAKQLLNGLRKDGKSIVECCVLWGISESTYNNWKKDIPAFAHAAEIGQMDCASWWHQKHRAVSSGEQAGNASCLNFGMKNVEGVKWADKSEVHTTHDEQIRTIRIEMLPSRTQPRIIDVEGSKSLPDEKSD